MSLRPRALAASAALLAGTLLLNSCAGSAGAPGDSQDGSGRQTVTFMGFFGTFQDSFTKTVIEPFEDANPDIEIEYVPIQNSAEVLAKLRASQQRPTADVALMDSSVAPTANAEGLFAKLDPALVPNLSELVDAARLEEGYGPGLTLDSLAILYNSDRVDEAPTSWDDLWDERFRGRLALPIADTRGVALIIALQHILGVDYQEDIDPAIDRLRELAPSVQTWQPSPDVYTSVQSGEVDVAVGWNARGQFYQDSSGGVVRPVLPEEGTVQQINSINLVNDSPNAEAAQKFIDYAIGAQAQKAFGDDAYYAPVNENAELEPETAERTTASEEQQRLQIPVDWSWLTSRYTDWVDRIKREVIGD
ncbi:MULTISPECIES: ABC transporter substrate-binding protein [unclassified Streptomyces]|uniref:ABC transporter substrate-binding protein n=1 Tax=unclassified Streptomyces TaxID=2593676 RepID=UPI000CD4BDD9|nr:MULTISPECIES: ABC transporter substrate-binding protein [unclassified Streptomyces]